MILVPQKCVGVLQLFPVNVDLFSSPCSLAVSAWHSVLASALFPSTGQRLQPQARIHHGGVQGTWNPAHFQPAATRVTSHISRDNWLQEHGIQRETPAGPRAALRETPLSQPAPLNSFYYSSHFTNYLIAAISVRLSRPDTHSCGRPRRHPRRPTL